MVPLSRTLSHESTASGSDDLSDRDNVFDPPPRDSSLRRRYCEDPTELGGGDVIDERMMDINGCTSPGSPVYPSGKKYNWESNFQGLLPKINHCILLSWHTSVEQKKSI